MSKIDNAKSQHVKSSSGKKDISIKFFNSFEEENEARYKDFAAMSPVECLAAVCEMRERSRTSEPDANLPFGDQIFFTDK